jgi:hypothetical protein
MLLPVVTVIPMIIMILSATETCAADQLLTMAEVRKTLSYDAQNPLAKNRTLKQAVAIPGAPDASDKQNTGIGVKRTLIWSRKITEADTAAKSDLTIAFYPLEGWPKDDKTEWYIWHIDE